MTTPHFETRSAANPEDETQLVERLAQARAALNAAASAWQERLRWQKANAEELFERRKRDIFRADLKAWRAEPYANNALFGTTALTAAWLKLFWEGILAGIASPIGITLEQAKDLVATVGGDWRADRIDAVSGRLMGIFLALSPRPQADLERWVAESLGQTSRRGRITRKSPRSAEQVQSRNSETTHHSPEFECVLARARHFLTTAPQPDQARAALQAVARAEMKVWPEAAERLRAIDRNERTRCAEAETCQDLGSAADIRETRRLRRELARAERRVEQLERRLAALRRRSIPKPARNRMKVASTDLAQQLPMESSKSFDFETSRIEPAARLSAARSDPNESRQMQSADSTSPEAVLDRVRATGESAEPVKTTRRPDPRTVAKAWRARSKPGFRKPGSKVDGRLQIQAAKGD